MTDDLSECCCKGTYGRASLASLFAEASITTIVKEPKLKGPPGVPGAKPVPDDQLKKPVTAGRARAEDLAIIPEGYVCEWAMLDQAGGGVFPIIGCAGNIACDRHHGPDKDTLNNSIGINLHRICDTCHNRWHALNDVCYEPERPKEYPYTYLPKPGLDWSQHDRLTRADPDDIQRSEQWWKLGIKERVPYRLWFDGVHASAYTVA